VGSHFLGRALREHGHQVRLIPAQFVRPFVKSNKNDYRDAEAIAEAVERENMRFVPIKTEDQLDLQALHRVGDRLVGAPNQRDQSDSSLPAGAGHKFPQGAGQPATADARDPGKCRRKIEPGHASAIGFLVAGVERPAVADREAEHPARTDCEQRSELCSIAADPRSRSIGVDGRRICHWERRGFQKGTRVRGVARIGATGNGQPGARPGC